MKYLLIAAFCLPLCALAQKRDSISVKTSQLAIFEVLNAKTQEFENKFIDHGDSLWILQPSFIENKILGRWRGELGFIRETFLQQSDRYQKFIQPFYTEKRISDSLAVAKEESKIRQTLASKKIYGIAITEYSVTGESYSGGFDIEFYNPTAKTIKYIWITTRPINPVGDLAAIPKTVRAIGPIKPNEFGSYEFEDVYYSNVIDKITVSKLKIQYMDGTIKEVVGTNLSKAWYLL